MDPTSGIFESIVDPRNAGVLAIAFAVMTVAVRALPPRLRTSGWTARMLPILPVPLCIAIVWIPGLEAAAVVGVGNRLALGAALGCGMSWGYKVWMQTILGRDDRIERAKAVNNGELVQ